VTTRPAPGAARLDLTLEIDGMEVPASGLAGQAIEDVLVSAGVARGAADRLSPAAGSTVVPGMRITLDRGVPVTVIDGGTPYETRTSRVTVAELLAARDISIGTLDRIELPPDSLLAAGSVVRITRIAERAVTERVRVPFAVRREEDPDLEVGTETEASPGAEGELVRTWLVRSVDGVEVARTLTSETQAQAPVEAVVRVGARPRPRAGVAQAAPPAPAGDVQAIIIAAAARWGADANQLLRVARCESGFNPNAYNGLFGASGVFQFIPSTWARNSPRAGYAGASVFDAVANVNTAAMMFAEGQAGQWSCK
jgi:resuscitation-promoting factor RpfB